MTPAVALAIIAEAVPPVKFIDWLPAYHIRVKEEAEEAKRAAYAAAQAEAASDSARASVEADASPSSAIAVTPVEEGSGAIGTTVTPSSAVVPVVSADSDASSQKAT